MRVPSAAGAGGAAPPTREKPKKLNCGHIFHFGCLRSWLERQQSCPTWSVPHTFLLGSSVHLTRNPFSRRPVLGPQAQGPPRQPAARPAQPGQGPGAVPGAPRFGAPAPAPGAPMQGPGAFQALFGLPNPPPAQNANATPGTPSAAGPGAQGAAGPTAPSTNPLANFRLLGSATRPTSPPPPSTATWSSLATPPESSASRDVREAVLAAALRRRRSPIEPSSAPSGSPQPASPSPTATSTSFNPAPLPTRRSPQAGTSRVIRERGSAGFARFAGPPVGLAPGDGGGDQKGTTRVPAWEPFASASTSLPRLENELPRLIPLFGSTSQSTAALSSLFPSSHLPPPSSSSSSSSSPSHLPHSTPFPSTTSPPADRHGRGPLPPLTDEQLRALSTLTREAMEERLRVLTDVQDSISRAAQELGRALSVLPPDDLHVLATAAAAATADSTETRRSSPEAGAGATERTSAAGGHVSREELEGSERGEDGAGDGAGGRDAGASGKGKEPAEGIHHVRLGDDE
jgi:E3 ubiquitin-protein ligase synoviolin